MSPPTPSPATSVSPAKPKAINPVAAAVAEAADDTAAAASAPKPPPMVAEMSIQKMAERKPLNQTNKSSGKMLPL